jgi:hypothetical protein
VADLVRIPRVPILSTGTYSLSSGEFTFTAEDLQAAAAAPANDPAVQWPRIKIDGLSDSFDPLAHGGEPAFGRVENMVVDGETLYGDYVIPPGLAAVVDWAFPSRSVEGAPASVMGPTATGRTHELVITAVALLGVDLPGVSTLPDLMDVLATFGGVQQPETVAVMATVGRDTSNPQALEAPSPRETPREVRAGLDQELVRRRFFDLADAGDESLPVPDGERGYDLWIRSLRFDDDGAAFLVVEAWESGRLYRYGFTVAGNEVSFDLKGEVVEQYVAASAAGRRASVAVWATRDDSRAVMAGTGGENGMTPEQIAALAAGYGLDPATATEADIMAAANAAAEARAAEESAGAAENETETEAVEEPVAVAAAASERTRTVSAAQWDETQSRLAAAEARLAEREQAETRTHRDGLIAAALRDGRIAPSERDQWRGDLDAAPDVTERILASLTPNRIPVVARGVDQQEGVNGGNAEQAHEQFMAGFGGSRRAKREVNGVTMITGAN